MSIRELTIQRAVIIITLLVLSNTMLLQSAYAMQSMNYRAESSTLTGGGGMRSSGGHAISVDSVGGGLNGTASGASYSLASGAVPAVVNFTGSGVPNFQSLSVTITGTGRGSVNSVPSGIACPGPYCSANFNKNSTVTLIALPDLVSTFTDWSGACSGSNSSCSITADADKFVTAAFAAAPPVRAGSTGYQTLQEALDLVLSGGTVRALATEFSESPVINRKVSIRLHGGYSGSYLENTGWTAVRGTLTIRSGRLTVERIKIR